MPDYVGGDEKGLKVDAVMEDRPGKKAGLQKGDIILQMGDKEIDDIYKYMEALGEYKVGDTTTMKVKRGEEELTLEITF